MTILSYMTVDFYLQVAKMVIVIAVAFILTWSPHYLVSITSVLQKSFQKTYFWQGELRVYHADDVFLWFSQQLHEPSNLQRNEHCFQKAL